MIQKLKINRLQPYHKCFQQLPKLFVDYVLSQGQTVPLTSVNNIKASTNRVKWRHSNLWSQYDLYVVRQHGVYGVKLSGEDLSRYSNKIESVGLRKCPHYNYLAKKLMSQ